VEVQENAGYLAGRRDPLGWPTRDFRSLYGDPRIDRHHGAEGLKLAPLLFY
jgi:hypothetical protein